MTAAEYQKNLAGRIGADEAEALRRGEGLYISEYNRTVCLRLLRVRGGGRRPGMNNDRAKSPGSPERPGLLCRDRAGFPVFLLTGEGKRLIILAEKTVLGE